MNELSGNIPSEIREDKIYILPINETEGTLLFHAITQEINHLNYQLSSYQAMDFPPELLKGQKNAITWQLNELVKLRQKMSDLKGP